MPRKATWALIIWTVVIGLLLYGITQSAGKVTSECLTTGGATTTCSATTAIAAGIWFVILGGLWFIGFVVLGIIWLGSRPQRRICPACGNTVKKGQFTCARCGFDFRAAAAGNPSFQPLPPTGPPPGWGQQPPQGPPQGWGQPPQNVPPGWGQPPTQPPQGPPPGWGPPPDQR